MSLLTEYNEEETMQMFKEEYLEEGREESLASSIRNLMKNLKLTAEQAMESLGIPENEYNKYMAML